MRRLANESPVVRIILIGGLLLVFVFLLYSRVLNREEETAAPPSDSAATASPAAGASTGPSETATPAPGAPETAPSEAPPSGAAPAVPAPVEPQTAKPPTGAFVPGRGLPKDVVIAYARGKAVVLLVMKPKGIEDKRVRAAVERLRGRGDVAVFVTRPKHIARYSQITQGVDVSRVPALVVLRPRGRSGAVPEATVSYGFRGAKSVAQALRDARYKGGKVPFYPE